MSQMTAQLEKTKTSLVMKRTFPAAAERIFRAWTEPEQLNEWFFPNDKMHAVSEVDLRKDGRYRIEMHSPEGGPHIVSGVYQEIVPNEKLVFTWRWQAEDAHPEMLITVTLRPVGPEETELILTHERFTDTEELESHAMGWQGTYDQLAVYLERTS